ncbi:hypothetical protein V6N11_010462 [Hibiscus sabdariffa]|uniref:Uncharacterized protein n=1 Tax=Hibiscus sabdariffa TaxID=183260 RepID=A0ABR2S5V8_9ROSI
MVERVSLACHEPRDRFWRRKRGAVESRARIPEEDYVAVPLLSKRATRRIEGVVSDVNMEVLSHCSIGRCRFPISNYDLVEALRLEKVGEYM